MSPNTVLTRGVRIVAGIHHSHGVKAAMSLLRLRGLFPNWTDDFVLQALQHSGWFEEPVVEGALFAPSLSMTPQRAQVLLARAVVPACYGATRVWVDASGLNAVVSNYFEQACADPGYLGHRLSILLALQEAWPLYRDGSDRLLFLDRLAEFILACRFVPQYDQVSVESATRDAALSAALARPGFFGHHVISLAGTLRNRDVLSAAQFGKAMAWVVRASNTTYPDEEDNVSITSIEPAHVHSLSLESALRTLLTTGPPNIHLLTLADSIAWLWNDSTDDVHAYLLALTQKFSAPIAP